MDKQVTTTRTKVADARTLLSFSILLRPPVGKGNRGTGIGDAAHGKKDYQATISVFFTLVYVA
jgi:hypothetical protein